MKKAKENKILRLLFVAAVLSLSLSVLFSCTESPELSKNEILENVDEIYQNDTKDYAYVYRYLTDYGITNFNLQKFLWVERVFQTYFNLEGGLPSTSYHAKITATSYLEGYYDKIDKNDKSAVTEALISCYVNAVGDPYSIYRSASEQDVYNEDMSGKFGGIGVVIEYDHENESIMVSSVYLDSPAEIAGIQAGDYIHAVNGKTVSEIGYLDVVYHVRGEIGTSVNLTLKRGDSFIDVVAVRAEVEEKTVSYEIKNDDVGYIQIVGFKANTYEQFVKAIDYFEESDVKGLVFDLRGNPGGYVETVKNMISYLIPSGHPIISYQYKGTPLQVLNSEDDVHPTKKDPENPTSPLIEDHKVTLPMVVICDEYTASAGELFTAALRDYNKDGILKAWVVGQTTFGKGIMQSAIAYSDKSSITLTVAYYNPPSGKNYHKTGITPNVTISNEILNGEFIDKQLEAALEVIYSLINAN